MPDDFDVGYTFRVNYTFTSTSGNPNINDRLVQQYIRLTDSYNAAREEDNNEPVEPDPMPVTPSASNTHWQYVWLEDTGILTRRNIDQPRRGSNGAVNGCACDNCFIAVADRARVRQEERTRRAREELFAAAQERERIRQRSRELIQTRNAEYPLTRLEDDGRSFDEGAASVGEDDGCEACKLRRFEHSEISSAVVHSYTARPTGGWRKRSVGYDAYPYGLGVELETSDHDGRVSTGHAAAMASPDDFWFAKRDGSVTGPEFASHPATLDWWRGARDELAKMFKMLLHAGYRSHDGNTAGMHINIETSAFADAQHFYRFLSLIHHTPNWSIKMSQRTSSSAKQWANPEDETFFDDASRERIAVGTFGTRRPQSTARYTALNVHPVSQGRFEFRLPRGTLRIDRFFKNLEWTVAMIEFTRNHPLSEANPRSFMRWVLTETNDEFSYLADFIREKFGASITETQESN